MFLPRTDLALEAAAFNGSDGEKKLSGVSSDTYSDGDITVTKVVIENEEGERLIGKPRGNYVTVECRSLREERADYDERVKNAFTRELEEILKPHNPKTILVVGLGNRFVTPDSLGPRVSDEITVVKDRLLSISPGVLGITGIQTESIVEGISEKTKPDAVIAIDALASRSMHRICTTIQIADTGITPGGGVGNTQKALNEATLGVPVIAVGVPTVVDASTLAHDAVSHMLTAVDKDGEYSKSEEKRYNMIKEILDPYFGQLIVTPSQIDCVITKVASIIAEGINSLGHKADKKII